MNKLLISLGSNEDAETNMSICRNLLAEIFELIIYSDTSVTSPYGKHYKNDFLNQLAFALTEMEIEEVTQKLKLLEKKIGRLPEDKGKGIVKIDIDLIEWNNTIMKEEEWSRDYIALLLPDLQKIISESLHDHR